MRHMMQLLAARQLAFRLLLGCQRKWTSQCNISAKSPKGFGRDAQIEGLIEDGQHILLVEDLATDGGSKLNFINAIRTAGAEVNHIFVIFYYDIFTDAMTKLAEENVSLHYLATWWDVLEAIKQDPTISDERVARVEAFLNAPVAWSQENGGQ